mmetsp:Transcript_13170/g.20435  ORF Transcript_13170/g.20435 Transcript_13170/m.20435 type:complete len:83 (-) Transcript_13170:67-315(-)
MFMEIAALALTIAEWIALNDSGDGETSPSKFLSTFSQYLCQSSFESNKNETTLPSSLLELKETEILLSSGTRITLWTKDCAD